MESQTELMELKELMESRELRDEVFDVYMEHEVT